MTIQTLPPTPQGPSLPNADKTQAAYCLTNESAKFQRMIATLFDFAAATIAFSALFNMNDSFKLSIPLISMLLALGAGIIRELAAKNHMLGQECRRDAIKAAATEVDVALHRQLTVSEGIPWIAPLASKFANPDNLTVWGNYGPYVELPPKGERRLRYLVAYSAFYTWQLTSFLSLIFFFLIFFFALATFTFVYFAFISVSVGNPSATPAGLSMDDAKTILDAICSVVIATICFKTFLAYKSSASTARSCREIVDRLRDTQDPSTITDLSISYEIERLVGFQPSTLSYLLKRKSVEAKWDEWRMAFV